VSDTQLERRELPAVDRSTVKLDDTPVEITLEVGRNFLRLQVINVTKLVSQSTSKGDGASHDSATFAIGDTSLARSTRVACENDMRSNKVPVCRPVVGVGVEFTQEDVDEESTLNGVLLYTYISDPLVVLTDGMSVDLLVRDDGWQLSEYVVE